jgi:UDP-glucose:glycoprotein glucosyltransferase
MQCNNPKTHEPKLARAKRLIPEWTVYDQEIAAVASQVAAENRLKAGADGTNSNTAGNSASDSAEAFTDEAGQLEQAREQQKEFVKEGTGSEDAGPKAGKQEVEHDSQGHIKGEL